jgi:hypothetical protein
MPDEQACRERPQEETLRVVFMWKGIGGAIISLFISGWTTTAPAAPPAESLIGKTGYVTERQPVHFCPAPQVGFQGCRKLTSGKITITSVGHEARLENTGGWLGRPAVRFILYGVKLNDKEDGFFHETSWYYLRSEEAHRAVLAKKEQAYKAALAEKAECDRRGGVKVGMTKAEVVASLWGKPKSINSTTTATATLLPAANGE